MNIIACIKQVPATDAIIRVKPDGSGIDQSGIEWVMNPYDEFAVEEALKIREQFGGVVTIVSLGPARTLQTVRVALAMGADKAIHINDAAFEGADAYTVASALAAAIRDIPYDIIFCGQRAVDDDSGQTGSILAAILNISQVTVVTKVVIEGNSIKAVRAVEGAQLLIESPLPAVVTAQKGLNEPRFASLPGIMKARGKPVDVKDAAVLGIAVDLKAEVLKITPPPPRSPGKILDGEDAGAKARALARLLREEAKAI